MITETNLIRADKEKIIWTIIDIYEQIENKLRKCNSCFLENCIKDLYSSDIDKALTGACQIIRYVFYSEWYYKNREKKRINKIVEKYKEPCDGDFCILRIDDDLFKIEEKDFEYEEYTIFKVKQTIKKEIVYHYFYEKV